jgi:hypothetical protein
MAEGIEKMQERAVEGGGGGCWVEKHGCFVVCSQIQLYRQSCLRGLPMGEVERVGGGGGCHAKVMEL